MTKFNVGDRVRLSPRADPARQAAIGGMLGTVEELNEGFTSVAWDTPNDQFNAPWNDEIELAPEPTLADTLRAKADATRAEAEEAQAKTDALAREWDAQSDRAITLRQEATALNAAAKILETL